MRRSRGVAIVAAIVLAVAGCSTIVSRQIYVRQANDSLQEYFDRNLADEWIAADVKRSADLAAGEREEFELTVRADEVVAVLGACDQDCGRLDLQLLDNGLPVTEFSEPTAHPFVRLEPGQAKVYTARITMAECDSEPCFVAWWVLRDPSPEIEELVGHYQETLANDWIPTGPIQRGDLGALRTRDRQPWELLGGQEASIVAVCDPNCGALSVAVIDEDGFPLEVTSSGSDRRRTVSFDVETTATYRFDIQMDECRAQPCSFAYWVLNRRADADDQ